MQRIKQNYEGMTLLERRNRSLHESRLRTEQLHKKASELGLIRTYVDHLGKLRILKNK